MTPMHSIGTTWTTATICTTESTGDDTCGRQRVASCDRDYLDPPAISS